MSDSATSWTTECHVSLSFTISWNLLKFMFTELVALFNHLIPCRPLFFLPSIFSSIRVFSSGSALPIRWASLSSEASASVLPVNIQGWFPFRLISLISLPSTGLKSLHHHHNSKAQFKQFSVLSFLCGLTLISVHDYWKKHSFDYTDFCQQSDVCAFLCCLGLS